jgi:hypothetical protein
VNGLGINGRGNGGGIFNSGSITITGGLVSGNLADDSGGGIANESGTLVLNDVVLNTNTALNSGGGLRSHGRNAIGIIHGGHPQLQGLETGSNTRRHLSVPFSQQDFLPARSLVCSIG